MRVIAALFLTLFVTSAAAAPPAPTVLDHGKLLIQAPPGKVIAEETFTVTSVANGAEREIRTETTSKITGAASPFPEKSVLRTDAAFRPLSGEVILGGKTMKFARNAKGRLSVGGATEKEQADIFLMNGVVSHLIPVCQVSEPMKKLRLFPDTEMPVTTRVVKANHDNKPLQVSVVGFSIGTTKFDVVCGAAKLLIASGGGLVVVRAGFEDVHASLTKTQYEKPAAPDGVEDVEKSVTTPYGAVLACSLMAPKTKKGKLPAVVFISGSGPQDRDGDSPGGEVRGSIFKVIAIALAQNGVASLRCDDPMVGKSTGDMKHITLDDRVADTRAGVEALRKEPFIDGDRIGVAGHSEGGSVAPLVGLADKKIKAVLLLAAMGRRFDTVVDDQRVAAMKAAGQSQQDIDKLLAHYAPIYAALREGKPLPADTLEAERKAFEPARAYFRAMLLYDPASVGKLTVPVMVAQGAKDFQVLVKDAELLRTFLQKGGNKRVTYKIYPPLSHLFAPAKTGTIADYSDPELTLDAAFLNDVVRFLKTSL